VTFVCGIYNRVPDISTSERVDANDLSINFALNLSQPSITSVGYIDSVKQLNPQILIVDGWTTWDSEVRDLTIYTDVELASYSGFEFFRSDLPTGIGARGFSVLLKLRSQKPTYICLTTNSSQTKFAGMGSCFNP